MMMGMTSMITDIPFRAVSRVPSCVSRRLRSLGKQKLPMLPTMRPRYVLFPLSPFSLSDRNCPKGAANPQAEISHFQDEEREILGVGHYNTPICIIFLCICCACGVTGTMAWTGSADCSSSAANYA